MWYLVTQTNISWEDEWTFPFPLVWYGLLPCRVLDALPCRPSPKTKTKPPLKAMQSMMGTLSGLGARLKRKKNIRGVGAWNIWVQKKIRSEVLAKWCWLKKYLDNFSPHLGKIFQFDNNILKHGVLKTTYRFLSATSFYRQITQVCLKIIQVNNSPKGIWSKNPLVLSHDFEVGLIWRLKTIDMILSHVDSLDSTFSTRP